MVTKHRKRQGSISFKTIFKDQHVVLLTTGVLSLVISFLYYTTTIIPYINRIGFWNTTLFFDSLALLCIVWFFSILTIHALTDPDKYCKYFDPE